jgi:hypothetical protein
MFKKYDHIGCTITSNKKFMKAYRNLGEISMPEAPSDGYKPANSKFVKWTEVPESEDEVNHFFQGELNRADNMRDGRIVKVYPGDSIELGHYKNDVHHG